MTGFQRVLFSLALLTAPLLLIAQEEDIEDLLNEEVMVENQVYKPVIAIGYGVTNFYGDVRNNKINPVIGDSVIRINISTFIDPKRYFKANFFLLYGGLSANHRSLYDSLNLNFETSINNFGVNLEYGFDHLFKNQKSIKPFVSIGIENIQFKPKGDNGWKNKGEIEIKPYNYWSDGTIRDMKEGEPGSIYSNVIYRDYIFEEDLRRSNPEEYDRDVFFAIPIDAGIDFKISDRVTCRLGTSLHITNTDFLDNVKSGKGNDMFTFSYFSLHFDLFSQPKTMIIEKMFAELEIDDVMFDDEDGDYILDPVDECPGTPYGTLVDSLGCPYDTDNDGIPDYIDVELNSAPGAWVDAEGRTISEEDYLMKILSRSEAMNRSEVRAYFETIGKGYVRKVVTEIPEKFRDMDLDKDGYISFDELLKAIDNYFDFKLNFQVEDIYELNNFFFEQ